MITNLKRYEGPGWREELRDVPYALTMIIGVALVFPWLWLAAQVERFLQWRDRKKAPPVCLHLNSGEDEEGGWWECRDCGKVVVF